MKTIGITTTVPVEVLLAAGYQPVDLNNIFITDPNPENFVNIAERAGFPLNTCTWIKGIYGVCVSRKIDTILCVTTGDCSNTIMLLEVLRLKKLKVIPFAYPDRPDKEKMQRALENLADTLGTTLEKAEIIKEQLKPARRSVWKLDEMTWKDNCVAGYENHLWLVSSSDFNRDAVTYQKQVQKLISECKIRLPYPDNWLRLGYIGVPSVFAPDFYRYLENNEAHIVFNEIQHQFSMPVPGKSLAEQYSNYTYPYSIYGRVKDIKQEIKRRRPDGIIHYIQAFCHRGIGDIIFRESLDLPILTIEGNQDYYLTQHMKTRIEAYLDMIRRKQTTH
jgi:benzoyl-CoA reductase/2-hydroxyglutaryl-CoA dehydratase subunit BcrC/BadD/HgdB